MEIYKKNAEIIEKENGDKLLLFNVDTGAMVELNTIAKLLWSNIKDSFSKEDLRKIIEDHCHSFDNIDNDLSEFIEKALEKDIIEANGKN
jgi:hypothetical protein